MIRGKVRDIGLGSTSLTTLAEARAAAYENQKLARVGGDPRLLKKRATIPTFAEAAAVVLENHRPSWNNVKHADDWIASLDRYAMSSIGSMLVSDIKSRDVLNVLMPISYKQAETT